MPTVVHTVSELRRHVADARRREASVGFVPTMGALHAGHLSLAERARQECGYVVASIFVNPLQFGPKEDYSRYPRTLEADCQLLDRARCDLVFAPDVAEMYPRGPAATEGTFVDVVGVTEMLEGACRPGHFRGVATVVLKLFNQVQPDVAYFGQKDFQQAALICQMTADLDLPLEIRVCPIIRDADGLALSSRNIYLSPAERRQALVLSRAVRRAEELFGQGERSAAVVQQAMHAVLQTEPGVQVEYAAVVDAQSLRELTRIDRPAAALVAGRVGTTRLIDNVILQAM